MDPRIGKANYGEGFRKLFQPEYVENDSNHVVNNVSKHTDHVVSDPRRPLHHDKKPIHASEQNGEKKSRNYRLVVDPALQPGAKKVYSINGVIPGVNEPLILRDPRHRTSKFNYKREPMELAILKLKHDQYSVGTILPKEVTFLNLNNNIDKAFLTNLCKPFGIVDDMTIYYHPTSKKHLGIGSALFSSTKAAKSCCEKLHNTSSMGHIMNVFIDVGGDERKKAMEEIINKKTTPNQPNSTVSTSTSFKSPSQNRIHKISSYNNITELCNVSNKHPSDLPNDSFMQHGTVHNHDNHPTSTHNGCTTSTAGDLPTPSYSDLGYFSSRHSDASEHILSSGGESVGSGNSSVILPLDPRLSRTKECLTKDNCRLTTDSPMGSDDFVIPNNHCPVNSLSSPFTPDTSKHQKHNLFAGSSATHSNTKDEGCKTFNFSSPGSCETETDQNVNSRDPRLSRTKDSQANSTTKLTTNKALVSKLSPMNNLNEDTRPSKTSSADDEEESVLSGSKTAEENVEEKAEMPLMSLESRIEAMLNQETSFNIPRNSSFSLPPLLDGTFGQSDPPNEYGESECNKPQTNNDDDDDDRMSMSSSDEPNNDLIEVNVPTKEQWICEHPPLPPQWPSFPFRFPMGVPMMPPYMPPYPGFFNIYDVPDMSSMVQESEEMSKFKKVLETVVKELQAVFSKDLRRKMVESTAFEVFDEWWSKNDMLDKKCGSGLFSQNPSNATLSHSSTQASKPANDSGSSVLNFLFEGQDSQSRMGFGSGGLLGLRGIAAKMPSFRKKYRAPTPPPETTDDNGNHCITHASDSESDSEYKTNHEVDGESDIDRDSVIKFRSSSYEEASDSDEESDESSDEGSGVEVTKCKRSRLRVYDSDDEEEAESASESGGTVMPSDESDDESIERDEDDDNVDEEVESIPDEDAREIKDRTRRRKRNSSVSSDEEYKASKKSRIEASTVRSSKVALETTLLKSQKNNSAFVEDEFIVRKSYKRKRRISEDDEVDEQRAHKIQKSGKDVDSPVHRPMPPTVPTSESHTSCRLFFPSQDSTGPSHPKIFYKAQSLQQPPLQSHKLSDVTNRISTDSKTTLQKTKSSRELQRLQCSFTPPMPRHDLHSKVKFPPRDYEAEARIVQSFVSDGIDAEAIAYLKKSYEQLILADYPQTNWLNETHWFDHTITCIPPPLIAQTKARRRKPTDEWESKHKTCSARTEGYYKISDHEKSRYLQSVMGVHEHVTGATLNDYESNLAGIGGLKKKVQQQSRDARSESRRWQSFFASKGEDLGDLLKFNQLKFRKKQLKFAKSGIHDWGLFALERIQEGEMVIEYVGQVIRQSTADIREKRYEAIGIGSSYLFRIDGDTIVDATKYGNLARFINHSCTPNCCAKIVTVESQKKIVIYSRRDIEVNEEITYDYKFPLEDKKIPCFCGSSGCRGSLN